MNQPARLLVPLTGIVLGVILGLVYSWEISPVKYVDAPPSALRADFKDDFVNRIGKYNVSLLHEISDLYIYDFGIFIEVSPDEEQNSRQQEQPCQHIYQGGRRNGKAEAGPLRDHTDDQRRDAAARPAGPTSVATATCSVATVGASGGAVYKLTIANYRRCIIQSHCSTKDTVAVISITAFTMGPCRTAIDITCMIMVIVAELWSSVISWQYQRFLLS
jgi:hypothetical protein